MALISCENVSLSYDGITVAEDISFEISSGDYYSIIGRNGSGKSTLLKALLKLKSPDRGTIKYGDGLTSKDIGYLAQQTMVQKDFPASVSEVVLSGCNKHSVFSPFYTRADKELAAEKMEMLDILNLRNKCFRELSGGQQQRVLIARALCASAKLLFLDEPVTGLDPVMMTELFRIVDDMHKNGITIVMVSHDIHCAVKYSTKILHMDRHILFNGSAEDYKKSDVGINFVGGHKHD